MPKINKLEKALNLWRARSLSLLGKALIINVLGLSKLLYLAKVLIVGFRARQFNCLAFFMRLQNGDCGP